MITVSYMLLQGTKFSNLKGIISVYSYAILEIDLLWPKLGRSMSNALFLHSKELGENFNATFAISICI